MPPGPSSGEFRAQVPHAPAGQSERFDRKSPLGKGWKIPRQLRNICQLELEAMSTLKASMEELGLSARALDKVVWLSRTIVDLEGPDEIKPKHIAEAVGYRSFDRNVWMKVWSKRPNDCALELTLRKAGDDFSSSLRRAGRGNPHRRGRTSLVRALLRR